MYVYADRDVSESLLPINFDPQKVSNKSFPFL